MWKNTIKKAPSLKEAHKLREILLDGITIAKAYGGQSSNFIEIHKHLVEALAEFDDIHDEEWNGFVDVQGMGTIDYTQPNNQSDGQEDWDKGNRYEQSS